MSKIVAGRFDNLAGAEAVLRALPDEGFARAEFESFFVTPPGQHATFPVGGDVYSDEGARHAGGGAIKGALVGGAIGFAAGIAVYLILGQLIAILAGTGLGAYVGSLIGALSKTRAGNVRHATVEHPVERPSGHMVAIRVDRPGSEPRAVETLKRYGARDIESTDGKWQAGDWKDFDPRIPAPPNAGVPERPITDKLAERLKLQ
jgi:hypothetical protein